MKSLNLIFIITLAVVFCTKQDKKITNKGIEPFFLGEKLKQEFNKDDMEIITDHENRVILIKVISEDYKTEEGIGIGSNTSDLITAYEMLVKKPIGSSKGNSIIGNQGYGYIHQNILFIDKNKDNIIDIIWIQEFKKQSFN